MTPLLARVPAAVFPRVFAIGTNLGHSRSQPIFAGRRPWPFQPSHLPMQRMTQCEMKLYFFWNFWCTTKR